MVLNKKFIKYWHQYWHLTLLLFVTFTITALYISINFISYKSVSVQAGICNFSADLADTPNKQFKGLSNRKSLPANEGMLFIFNEIKDKSFVMRDMNFPLDIIFIRDNTIVNLYHGLKPEGSQPQNTYHSGTPIDTVLEITAGESRRCQLVVGTKVTW